MILKGDEENILVKMSHNTEMESTLVTIKHAKKERNMIKKRCWCVKWKYEYIASDTFGRKQLRKSLVAVNMGYD